LEIGDWLPKPATILWPDDVRSRRELWSADWKSALHSDRCDMFLFSWREVYGTPSAKLLLMGKNKLPPRTFDTQPQLTRLHWLAQRIQKGD
jgi:hypothetical protein